VVFEASDDKAFRRNSGDRDHEYHAVGAGTAVSYVPPLQRIDANRAS
jgi:hypothetical protein